MRTSINARGPVFLLVLLLGRTEYVTGSESSTEILTAPTRSGAAAREGVRAAILLLPRPPVRIAVMDVTTAKPEVRDRLLRLDAFTVVGDRVIYVVDRGELLRGAQVGSEFHRAALAAVIWHEMAHVEGADERAARKVEIELWKRFVRDGMSDSVTALRYLRALSKRPDDELMASR